MTTADRWILRGIGIAAIALIFVVGWEAYTNGEQFKATQAALLSQAKSGASDLHSISTAAVQSTQVLNQTVTTTGKVVGSLNGTIESINRPCGTGKPCGTLADVNRTLATVRGTFGQVELAARHENRNLTQLDLQEDQLFSDTHDALHRFSGTIDAATDTIHKGGESLDSLNSLLKDQAVRATVTNIQSMTGSAAGILADGKIFADRAIAPKPWYQKLWGYAGDTYDFTALIARHTK